MDTIVIFIALIITYCSNNVQLSSKTKQKLKIKITGSEHTYQLEEGSEAALAAAYYSTAILGLQLPLPA